jgi:hypothetical protein
MRLDDFEDEGPVDSQTECILTESLCVLYLAWPRLRSP